MVWNDQVIAGTKKPPEQLIIQGVYDWHPGKAKFTSKRISDCIRWMKEHELVPLGMGSSEHCSGSRRMISAVSSIYARLPNWLRKDSH